MENSSRVRRLRCSLATVVAALLATVSLAACSPDQLGSAAIVDGTTISADSLQSHARAYLAIVPNADRATVQQHILEEMIFSSIIKKAADANDVHVSQGAVAKQLAVFYKQTKNRRGLVAALAAEQSPVIVPPGYVDSWLHDQLLYHKLVVKLAGGGDATTAEASTRGSNALSAAAKSMKVVVNPRYGTWDPKTGSIDALVSGGLALTTKQLNATK
jgi:SurA N-terminal domain